MRTNDQVSKNRSVPVGRMIDIELLAIDLSRCTRCNGTLNHIQQAIEIIRPALEAMQINVNVRQILIDSEEMALLHRFATSPTVRMNGKDIAWENLESECDSCSDLCGCHGGISCRVWTYRGKQFTAAPVGLIVESILRAIADDIVNSKTDAAVDGSAVYNQVPENLRRFFRETSARRSVGQSCCSTNRGVKCCEAS